MCHLHSASRMFSRFGADLSLYDESLMEQGCLIHYMHFSTVLPAAMFNHTNS